LAQAHEKLAAYRLPDPDAFLLLLIEVAHLLPECVKIRFGLGRVATHITLVGVALSTAELRTVFDALFLDLDGLDPAVVRRGLARRQLASALNTALGLRECVYVELCSTIAGKHQARLRFRPGAEPELDERPSDASDSSLTFSLRERRSLVEIGHVHA